MKNFRYGHHFISDIKKLKKKKYLKGFKVSIKLALKFNRLTALKSKPPKKPQADTLIEKKFTQPFKLQNHKAITGV